MTALVLFLLFLGAGSSGAAQSDSSSGQLFERALALAKQNRLEEARALFEQGESEYPLDKRFPLELAGIAFRQKDRSAARSYLHHALQLDPEDRYGRDFLGTVYLLDGNLPAALEQWNRIGKPLISAVRVTPSPAGSQTLLQRSIEISGGQLLTLQRYYATCDNLRRTGLLVDPQWDLVPSTGERFDLTIRSVPTGLPLRGWLGQTLPLLRGLPYETVNLDSTGLDRAGIHEGLLRWDTNKRRLNLEGGRAIRSNPRSLLRFSLDARDERWRLNEAPSDFRLRRVEAGASLVLAINQRLEWTTGALLARRYFTQNAFQGGWLFEVPNTFRYALLRAPEHRLTVDSSGTLRTGRAFHSSTYQVLESDLAASWYPQAKGEDWHVAARLRDAKTLGTLPFDQLFELGMERDNDLWLRGHLGARGGPKGSAPLGSSFVLQQTQVDRRVFEIPFVQITAGPFFDIGRVWKGYGRQGWLPDAGLQAKVKTIGRFTVTVSYGRDLRGGRGAFFATVSR